MSHPAPFPALTLAQWEDLWAGNAFAQFGFAPASTQFAQHASDVVLSFFLWSVAAQSANELHFLADLEDIAVENSFQIRDAVVGLDSAITQAITEANGTLIAALPAAIEAGIGGGFANLQAPLDELVAIFFHLIHPDLEQLTAQQRQFIESLVGSLLLIAQDQARRDDEQTAIFSQQLAQIAGALGAQRGPSLEEWLARFSKGQAISTPVTVQTLDVVSPFLADEGSVWNAVTEKFGQVLAAIAGLAFKGADLVAPIFKPLVDETLDTIQKRVLSLGQVSPGDAFSVAREFLAVAMANGLKARLISVLMEKGGDQIKNLGIQQVAGLMGELGGFSQLADAVWGNALQAGIGRPAEYQVNSLTLSKIPSEGQLIEAAIERKVSVDALRELLKFHGYGAGFTDMLINAMWTDPRLREIVLLASDVSVTFDDVQHWLQEAGYDDNDVARMAPVVIQQSLKGQRQAFTSEILANLREGYLDDEEAEAQFQRLRMTPEAIQLLLDTGRLAQRRDLINEHIVTLTTQFDTSQIGEPELRLGLSALGIRPSKVDALVGRAVSKFNGRVAREEDRLIEADVRELQRASLAALREQFRQLLISAEAFRINLEAIGFLPAVAREIVTLEQLRLLSKIEDDRRADAERLTEEIRRARIAAFVELFQDGLINEQQLFDALVQLAVDPELARAIVFREQARKAELPAPAS